jgi:SHS2 domain-containing protein
MNYEYLDHTADLKIRAYGKTLEEAFVNVALGAFNFLTDTSKVKKQAEHRISLKAERIESLLYDFMEELLFLLDTEGLLVSGFKEMKIRREKDKFLLQCAALGDNYKSYKVKGDIKAVTYSEMSISKEKDGFVIQVVFDI